jgi:asparagine synthase (glutamine-hydrolysing)
MVAGGRDTAPDLDLPSLDSFAGTPVSVVLGHRRLSILDLSSAGHQPMASADHRYWVTYNGEIYNYLELRLELERAGHRFHTTGDTEVVLAAYAQWGADMLRRFTGMFALVILDTGTRELFMARDHFGIKPLFYTALGDRIAFASEIKALLELEGVSRRGNAQEAYQYLRFGERHAGPVTMFDSVSRFPAAHYACVRLDGSQAVRPVRFWRVDLSNKQQPSFDEARERIRELFLQSVTLHMRSDVAVGSCLSGGLDSTAIVMGMQPCLGDGRVIHAVSFITDDPVLSEERYVDFVPGAEVHKVRISPDEIEQDMTDLIQAQELPFGSLSIYAQFRVFRCAQENGLKVMLDGQGSDEIFAGYLNLIGAHLTGLLCRGEVRTAIRILRRLPSNMRGYHLRMMLSVFGRMLPGPMKRLAMCVIGEQMFPEWLDRGWFQSRSVIPRIHDQGYGRDSLRQELLLSIEELSLPQLLRYEDCNSMWHSIESRVPFCNPELAELAFTLPPEFLVSSTGETKFVFREAMKGIVPEPILAREKVGFGTPDKAWLRQMGSRLSRGLDFSNLPFVRPHEVKKQVGADLASPQHMSQFTWRCINLSLWTSHFGVGWG